MLMLGLLLETFLCFFKFYFEPVGHILNEVTCYYRKGLSC
jgi:hypothetical protein